MGSLSTDNLVAGARPPSEPGVRLAFEPKTLIEGMVYCLYEPPDKEPHYDVIFFHGLQPRDYRKAWRNTWESELEGKQKVCWPAEMLSDELPRARMLSVSYDSSAKQTWGSSAGSSTLVELGMPLTEGLYGDRVRVGTRPVVLVGHSLGGLMIKQICLELDQRSRNDSNSDQQARARGFLQNIKGLVFFATPHGGSILINIARAVTSCFPCIVKVGGVVPYLSAFSTKTARLNHDFEQLRRRLGWRTLGFSEKGMDEIVPINEDHRLICKPTSMEVLAFTKFSDFLTTQLGGNQSPELADRRTHPLIGRLEELEVVCKALREGKVAVIHGGPGEGKSRLAAEAASHFGRRNAFIDLASGGDWSSQDEGTTKGRLARLLLIQLRPEGDWPVDAAAWGKLLAVLEESSGAPILVVYDNTEAILSRESAAREAFYGLVRQLCLHKAHQIITSRVLPTSVEGITRVAVQLSRLSIEDSVNLLMSKGQGRINVASARAIAEKCECNALLLHFLSASIADNACSAKDVVNCGIRVLDGSADLDKVQRVISLAKDFMSMCLRGKPAQLEWVARISLWHSFTPEQAGLSNLELHQYLRLSIIQPAVGGRYSMHLIMREAARELLEIGPSEKLEAAQMFFLESMAVLGEQLSASIARGERPAASAGALTELPNCLGFCSIPGGLLDESFSRKIGHLGDALRELGYYAGAAAVLTQALKARQRVLGYDHPNTLTSMNNLAAALHFQGKHVEAEAMFKEVLEASQRVLGHDHPDTLPARGGLATALLGQGKHVEAEVINKEVLEVRRRVLGHEHPDTLTSMSNLATALHGQGKHVEAEVINKEVLEARRRVLGHEHPSTLTSMNNLAAALDNQGKHVEAEVMYKEVIEVRQRVLGHEHPSTLASMHRLAGGLLDQGKHVEAEVMFKEVLEARQRGLGHDHPDTLMSMNNLAAALHGQGKYVEAEVIFTKVLKARQRVLGPEHPDTLTSMSGLAAMLHDKGKHVEAEAMYKEVIEARRRVLGYNHLDTLWSMYSLARSLHGQGKHAEAEVMFKEVLEARRRVLGPEHPDTLTSMYGLAAALLGQGKHAEAEAMFQEVLEARRRVLGHEHPDTLETMHGLAVALHGQGKHVEAEVMYKEVIEARQRVLGHDHPDTLWSMHRLAGALHGQGKHAEAEVMYKEVIEAKRRVLGHDHPDTLLSMHNLAVALHGQGKHVEAEVMCKEVLEVRQRVLGPEHPDTLMSMRRLAAMLEDQGQHAEANAV